MTDDLVKRLRSPEVFLMTSAMVSPVAYDAADRIEKLEAALEDALQYVSRADWHYLKDETRKALEGKDD
jgi:hypothetical protein